MNKLILVLGAVGVGKTTVRREKYSVAKGFVNIDAGDIFIDLSKGGYYDFPSHLKKEMMKIGKNLMIESLCSKKDIVLEFPGSNYDDVIEITSLAKKLGYSCELDMLQCDINLAWERNISRGDNNISSYFYEKYHMNWFRYAAKQLLK